MKKYLLSLFLLIPALANAWWDLSEIYAGPNLSRNYFKSPYDKYVHYKPGFSLGFFADFKTNNKISYQTGIMIQNSGYTYDFSSLSNIIQSGNKTYTISVVKNRINNYSAIIPFNFIYKLFKKDKVYFGFFVGQTIVWYENRQYYDGSPPQTIRHEGLDFKEFNFGLNLGFGHGFNIRNHQLYVKLSNALGMQFFKPTGLNLIPLSNCISLHLGCIFAQ